MNRGIWVGVVLLLAGCTAKKYYLAPPEELPPPSNVNGVQVEIKDDRPEQERMPFTGHVSLYHPSRVKPSPWEQLVRETEAVVATLPEKPERVEIVVTSFRLVQKDAIAAKRHDGDGRPTAPAKTGDGAGTSNPAPEAGVSKGLFLSSFLDDHPAGASCAVRATVRFFYHGGREKKLEIDRIAAGHNTSGTKYWGEALEEAVKMAVRQYGTQLRQDVGVGDRR